MTATFIEAAIYSYKKGVKLPSVLEAIVSADDEFEFSSPFNSIFKIRQIIAKCKGSAAEVTWCSMRY